MESSWSNDDARLLATRLLRDSGSRWKHVNGVGQRAQALTRQLGPDVVGAAWLHDVGYAPDVSRTGFHALDGARYLKACAAPDALVSLVAYHSGAVYEAKERGYVDELAHIPIPDGEQLDALTYLDMTTGPKGQTLSPRERIKDILERYPVEHPVHRAVAQSRDSLLAACDRASTSLERR